MRRIPRRSVAEGARGGGQLLIDRIDDPAPVGEPAGVPGGVQFVRLLLREVAAGEAVLQDQHSGDERYVGLDDHRIKISP